jgi:hypothetical protein
LIFACPITRAREGKVKEGKVKSAAPGPALRDP